MIPIEEICRLFADRPVFIQETGKISYREFGEWVAREAFDISQGRDEALRGLKLQWEPGSLARFVASLRTGGVSFIGEAVWEGDLEPFLPYRPLLILRTGGTTGPRRHVVHSLERFLSPFSIQNRSSQRQLIFYAADHLAGIDAFLRLLYTGGSLILPGEATPEAKARSIQEFKAEVLAATPAQLRFLMLRGSLEGLSLGSVRVISHGAEPMQPRLREQLEDLFPSAKLVQRFGMTELGALPARMDPQDPAALILEGEGYGWKLVDGELHVCAPTRMLGTLEKGLMPEEENWFATGDLAERTENGSMRILGRRETLINVGGYKVFPEVVEALILSQPGVLAASARGVPNPLTGQAVEARMVHEGNPDLVEFLRALRQEARSRGLDLACVPTKIEVVGHLELTPSGKLIRDR